MGTPPMKTIRHCFAAASALLLASAPAFSHICDDVFLQVMTYWRGKSSSFENPIVYDRIKLDF